jgi:hypothetical protein
MQQFHEFITWRLCVSRDVSGVSPLVIISFVLLSTHWAKTKVSNLTRDIIDLLVIYDSNNSTNKMQQFHEFITWRLCVPRDVSGVSPLIIISFVLLSTHWEKTKVSNLSRDIIDLLVIYDSNNSTNKMQEFHKFITWRLCVAQHVSGVSTPIIKSIQLH